MTAMAKSDTFKINNRGLFVKATLLINLGYIYHDEKEYLAADSVYVLALEYLYRCDPSKIPQSSIDINITNCINNRGVIARDTGNFLIA